MDQGGLAGAFLFWGQQPAAEGSDGCSIAGDPAGRTLALCCPTLLTLDSGERQCCLCSLPSCLLDTTQYHGLDGCRLF